ncbi:isochorismate synthase/isochorismate-pyruvate lyase mbtI [Aspergillus uvarum CBS 121591]|uniref:Isochorismate synthase/isochorismate-pyruvate lyase mbtI n=1 Tax=Aspergillus uvarum CBS 121591 TaxID=1448315 RepID=A0A319CMM6_9EURO|nr:isochorismate synthase/isochorismate-pyruvate lyase mbtI [Aspergillus uvarum CBS 121591]PYH85649.1 isochorismate synthase/isochorismate-pyruvate lyase mbtI [Aspergillus uvarum CBS 121591]
MSFSRTAITLTPGKPDALERVVEILRAHKSDDYYAYEREGKWHLGIGSHSSLVVDAKGETATVSAGPHRESHPITSPLADVARDLVSKHANDARKVFGYVGFNYAAHARGIPFTAGRWPLVSLMVPRIEISINTQDSAGEYLARVQTALAEIVEGKYTKVIPSRAVEIAGRVDMPATLLCGRRCNAPARSFSLSHGGYQATGFSPELVMSVKKGKVTTEPLAGTRSRKGKDTEVERLRQELLNDSKEIVEHVISVREAIDELKRLCPEDTVSVEDLMSVRPRGSVQHLGSTVTGFLKPEKDPWDALDVLFPSITASGIPKQAALEGIQRLEHRPRELYSGAVLMIEGNKTLEAALVLRTVFQDQSCQWVQAGAGVIAQSTPARELTETQEKLASIAPFV